MTDTIKMMLAYTEKKALLPPLLAGFMASLTGLGLMGAGAWLIAMAAQQPPLFALALGVTCVRACGIFRAVFRYLERYLGHSLAFRSYHKLQQFIYAQACTILPLKTGPLSQGLWLERLTKDCFLLRDAYVRALLPLALNLLLTICFCLALWSYHPLLSLILLFTFTILILLGWQLAQIPSNPPSKSSYGQELQEMAEGNEELLAAGSATPAMKRLGQSAEQLQLQQRKTAQHNSRNALYFSLLKYLGFTLLIYELCMLVPARMDYIELAVWLLLLLTLMQDYNHLLPALEQLKNVKKAGHHLSILRLYNANDDAESFKVKNTCLLNVKNLSFGYNGALLFSQLSFNIAPHQHTAIIGESGRGKTTLAYLLTGMYRPDSGTLSLSVPFAGNLQGCFVFSNTIRENFLRLHPGLDDKKIIECLKMAQLKKWLDHLPQGLDTPLGYDGNRLSGGERNRLLTALALGSSAPLIILDEPTAGLDKKTASELLTSLFQRAEDAHQTLLVITHDLGVLDRFSQVIEL